MMPAVLMIVSAALSGSEECDLLAGGRSAWCCDNYGVGCESEKFRCGARPESLDELEWCCREKGLGCFLQCDEKKESTKEETTLWGEAYCCKVKGTMCAEPPAEETPEPRFRLQVYYPSGEARHNPKRFVRRLRMSLLAMSPSLRASHHADLVVTVLEGKRVPSTWNTENLVEERQVMNVDYTPEVGETPTSFYKHKFGCDNVTAVEFYVNSTKAGPELFAELKSAHSTPASSGRSHQSGHGLPLHPHTIEFYSNEPNVFFAVSVVGVVLVLVLGMVWAAVKRCRSGVEYTAVPLEV